LFLKTQVLNVPLLVLCSAFVLFTHSAFADGKYQRTNDRKIWVWNDDPQPRETVTWSGDQDDEGYAIGHGTLTWYTTRREVVTGSSIPVAKPIVYARYSGNMVQGKLHGPVNVSAKGKIAHATFTAGKRNGDWSAGPAPTRDQRPKPEVVAQTDAVEPAPPGAGPSPSPSPISNQEPDENRRRDAIVETPAEGPSPAPVPPAQPPSVAAPVAGSSSNPSGGGSIRSLTAPPSGLRTNANAPIPSSSAADIPPASADAAVAAPPPGPRLKMSEVVDLANAEARKQGFDLRDYQRGESQHAAETGTWLVSYEPEAVDRNGMSKGGKPFKVSIEDNSRKASIVPDK
jgi:hypothetical protein